MSGAPPSQKVDRQTTTPFLLKLFYRTRDFHRVEEFAHPPNASSLTAHLPPHLQIYTWPTCTLRELTHLLTSTIPTLLPSPTIGTRVAFRLVFPDTRSISGPPSSAPGRFTSKDLGSVVVSASSDEANGQDGEEAVRHNDSSLHLDGEADKTLADARFVIGDYVSCAIVPPLADGTVAPPPSATSSSWPSRGGFGGRGGPRENGGPYGDSGFRVRGGGRGNYGAREFGSQGSGNVPSGEWRRGERIPDGPMAYERRSRGRGRGW